MPVQKCQYKGKQGFKFGETGKCFTGKQGRAKATKQGKAINISQKKNKR